ncbi:hypothetical protein [Halobacillus halophilus]|uniref:hypothetical protein n=1 Tax=Halobacillus halophilus TaxID=1570 RepID=UPI001CD32F4F|nr:hypothetical protein [Halobacillus halophilus]MCA1011951.1 hypothetical protein [Halobacillus halophilus]
MKVIEILLLIAALISLSISLFIQIDFLIMTTLFGGIGFSVLRFVRTYEQRKNQVLGKPNAKYYSSGGDSFDMDGEFDIGGDSGGGED